jgi:hypothetical protein
MGLDAQNLDLLWGDIMNSFRKAAWLLAALAIVSAPAHIAHANGVSSSILSGDTKTGTVTGTGVDSYTFRATAGSAFVANVAETGTHDATFIPKLDLLAPGGGGTGNANTLFTRLLQFNAAEGTWTIKVSRGDDKGLTGGTYALTLVQVPGAGHGTALARGRAYSGSYSRSTVDVYTFAGVTGHAATLTLTPTDETGSAPEITVFTPSGDMAGRRQCITSCDQDVATDSAGTYTVLVWKHDANDVAGTYTLTVNDKN